MECNTPQGAEIPSDNTLDRVTGSDPSVTDYILATPAKCPNCKRGFWKMLSLSLRNVVTTLGSIFSLVAGCWKWVCDCIHCVEPLTIARRMRENEPTKGGNIDETKESRDGLIDF